MYYNGASLCVQTIDMGAVVSEAQLATITEYVEDARNEGAEIFQAPCETPKKGLYYPPTLITNVQTTSRVVQEEVSDLFSWHQTFDN